MIDLVAVYEGFPDSAKDRAIRNALKGYDTGSGFGFGHRDHTATVPAFTFEAVLEDLKKIEGVRLQKLVGSKWLDL